MLLGPAAALQKSAMVLLAVTRADHSGVINKAVALRDVKQVDFTGLSG